MSKYGLIITILFIFFTKFTLSFYPYKFSVKIINFNMLNNELKNIDIKLDELCDKIKKLKKEKLNMLSNIKGLNMTNQTNDDPLNYNINEDDTDDIFKSNINNIQYDQIPNGIKVIFNKHSINVPSSSNQNIEKNTLKSENFEIIKNSSFSFNDIGGYDNVKEELIQCSDLLINYQKYSKFNVRSPKGLILEGPPGNGKTLLAKCFSGEINVNFIAVSGAQFQEKYVGVGSSRIRELFKLASENLPCIIFIDEIDALGRKRSSEEVTGNSERDNTLNELLVSLDGFNTKQGIFIICATNRIDLLDSALIRPGRIDKKIYIGNPDKKTRSSIIDIHIKGKPYSRKINKEFLLEVTQGFSGAQIENLLNEAMLYAIRNDRDEINVDDIEIITNRILTGWQPSQLKISNDLLYKIAIHEMGHAIVGIFTDHSKLIKIQLNLWSPKTPGFTLFDNEDITMYTKNQLLSHLMVLLGGRIAEEEFFNNCITTGASDDLNEAKKLAEKIILSYGMGTNLVNSFYSEKNKENIDTQIKNLIDISYNKAKLFIINCKPLIEECANILIEDNILKESVITNKINNKYPYLLNLKNK